MQFIVSIKNSQLAITNAVGVPLDQNGNPIYDAAGNQYGFPANAGVITIADVLNGFTVAMVKVAAKGFKSVTVLPASVDMNSVGLEPGLDSYQAPPRAMSPQASAAVQQNVTALIQNHNEEMQSVMDGLHFHMKMFVTGTLLILALAGIYYFVTKKG